MAPLLSIRDLRTWFDEDGRTVHAVDGVSFDIERGETLGLVGESGSGKTVTSLSILRLVPSPPGRIVSGAIEFDGRELLSLPARAMQDIRGRRIAMIFQDPMTSLNPFMRVSAQLMEVTRRHLGLSKAEARARAIETLESVGFPEAPLRADTYPHQLSGGMRQRVMIAMALQCRPDLLIADEPTTALDVTIQAQILDLLRQLKQRFGMSVLLITHDLGVVAGMADRTIVMYAGRVFEQAPTRELFRRPSNPYTIGLLRSVPDPTASGPLYQIRGLPPDLAHLPPGCPFAPRCDRAEARCVAEAPPLVSLNGGHLSRCHFARELYDSVAPPPVGDAATR